MFMDSSKSVPYPLWATLVATFFGAGRLKPGPGTWGSLATVILWALASSRIPVASRTWATIVAAALSPSSEFPPPLRSRALWLERPAIRRHR
jgi:phosphatidylglycerophosphatase A